jgi:hypothetical protein
MLHRSHRLKRIRKPDNIPVKSYGSPVEDFFVVNLFQPSVWVPKSTEQPFSASCVSYPQLDLEARDSVSISSGHRIQNFESEALRGRVGWIGEERFIDRCQCQLRPVLRQQHLASAPANNAVFR